MKQAFAILEKHFSEYSSEEEPPLTLEFSTSALMTEYRSNNHELTLNHRGEGGPDVHGLLTTLLNNPPPKSDTLQEEGS